MLSDFNKYTLKAILKIKKQLMHTKQLIQIENISVQELTTQLVLELTNFVSTIILENKPEEELLTREQTARLLKVSLVTLWSWTKKDIVPAYRIGNKVRYKKSEVLDSLIKMNSF
jgi:excisionase family DNA binding protein